MNGTKKTVRISESAWESIVSRLLRGEVIDIQVEPLIEKEKYEDPPKYSEAQDQHISSQDVATSESNGSRCFGRWFNRL